MNRSRALVSVLALVVSGCQVNLDVPEGTVMECDSDAQCPDGWVCKLAIGRCVETSGADQTPPSVVTSSITPVVLRPGAAAQIELTVSEALAALPAVRVGSQDAHLIAQQDLTYTFGHAAIGTEAEGDVNVVVGLVDRVGNESTTPLGTLRYDFTAPGLIGDPVAAPASLRLGQDGTLAFEVDEVLGAPPAVSLSNGAALTDTGAATLPHYQFLYAPQGGESEGLVTAQIILTDVAGNTSTFVTEPVFTLDFTPPALDPALDPVVLTPSVTTGQLVGVSFWTTEPLAAAATVELVPRAGGVSLALQESQRVASEQTFRYAVAAGDADGIYDIVLTSMSDAAGNTAGPVTLGAVTIDSVGPTVSNVQLSRARVSKQSGFDSFTLSFDVDEDVGAVASGVLVRLAGQALDSCSGAGSGPYTYTCDYAVTTDPEGLKPISITVQDAAGNLGFAATEVAFDYSAPDVSFATVTYLQPPGSPLAEVQRAREGTTIRVVALASEQLSATLPTLTLSLLGTPTTTLTLPVVADVSQGNAVFDVVVPPAAVDGTYVPEIHWSDVAGNEALAATFSSPAIAVKTSVPTMSVVQAQVLYVRSPHGQAQRENLGSFEIPAGPYYALSPPDSLADTDHLDVGTFLLDGTDLPQLLRVWGDANRVLMMGSVAPNADGSWPRLQLAAVDAPTLYVSGLDDAGNETAAVKIDNAEWVATANPSPFGTNPHRAQSVPAVRATRAQTGEGIVANLEGVDSVFASAHSEVEWRRRQLDVAAPSPRRHASLTYDAARGRVVLFGGVDDGGTPLGDTWEWDGERWTQFQPASSPPARYLHAAAYDSARGTVVILGGEASTSTFLQDFWEWDGTNWTKLGTASARSGAAMAYDPGRDRLVLYGGWTTSGFRSGVSEWNGTSWQNFYTAGPTNRAKLGMAYDPGRQSVVIFGGCTGVSVGFTLRQCNQVDDQLWEWDGAWHQISLTTVPSGRYDHAMVYDPTAGGRLVVMFGDVDDDTLVLQGDVWSWDGVAQDWHEESFVDATPGPRRGAVATYDRQRGGTLVFGGRIPRTALPSYNVDEAWELRGSVWADLTLTGQWPAARAYHAMAYDPRRERTVLFGGNGPSGKLDDVWEWNGANWQPGAPTTSPPARSESGMAYDGTSVVVFGGSDASSTLRNDMWSWNGTDWSEIALPAGCDTAGTCPSARRAHSMTYDSGSASVLLFGGVAPGYNQELWRWSAGAWSEIVAASPPSPRQYHAAAFDGVSLWIFGGSTATGYSQELFTYDPTAGWTDLTTTTPAPIARASSHATFERSRSQLIVYGGVTTTTVYPLGRRDDTWLADGTDGTWSQVFFGKPYPDHRNAGAMVFDARRDVSVLFGGTRVIGTVVSTDELWELDASAARQPAIQFVANAETLGSARSAITNVRVRAMCGAAFAPYGPTDVGANLWGWSAVGAGGQGGGWLELKPGSEGSSPASFVDWSTAGAAEAQQLVTGVVPSLAFQCRSAGVAGTGEATVVADYIEVRVRYSAP